MTPVSFASSGLTAEVNPLGAQLSALRDRTGRDLLWDGDPSVWTGRAPLLFPIIGTLAGGCYRLGSTIHHLPRHGFARGKLFDIVDATSASAAFRLKADEASLLVYPFRFELEVQFALDGPTLLVTTHVRNAGDEDMPASYRRSGIQRRSLSGASCWRMHCFKTTSSSSMKSEAVLSPTALMRDPGYG